MASVTIKARSFARHDILAMYKECLTLVRKFPSVKRDEMYQDVRLEFRDHAKLTDPVKIAHAVEVGMRGIATMRKYTGLDSVKDKWTLDLEQDPLGQAFHEQRKAEETEERRRTGASVPEQLPLEELRRRVDALQALQDDMHELGGDVLRIPRDD